MRTMGPRPLVDEVIGNSSVRHHQMRCDFAGCSGRLVTTGEAFMVHPPSYVHVCSKCGEVVAVRGGKQYPIMVNINLKVKEPRR